MSISGRTDELGGARVARGTGDARARARPACDGEPPRSTHGAHAAPHCSYPAAASRAPRRTIDCTAAPSGRGAPGRHGRGERR